MEHHRLAYDWHYGVVGIAIGLLLLVLRRDEAVFGWPLGIALIVASGWISVRRSRQRD